MGRTITFKGKVFTQYDSTDVLKTMKDSDILAEKKKDNSAQNTSTLTTAGLGAGVGATLGGAKGLITKGMKMGKAGKVGGALGAVAGLTLGMAKNQKAKNENEFFNDRLEYAQKQAKRREKKDWKSNMTTRDGYTY